MKKIKLFFSNLWFLLRNYSKVKAKNLKVRQEESKTEKDPSGKSETDSDFLRYVKLRIPNPANPAPPTSTESLHGSQAEMLAIQPEMNPKSRPSLSRKEQKAYFRKDPFIDMGGSYASFGDYISVLLLKDGESIRFKVSMSEVL